jgi:hypothetical protein
MTVAVIDLQTRIANLEAIVLGGPNPQGTPSEVAAVAGANVVSASGAVIPGGGNYVITKAGVAAITLAVPTAGSVANGGIDGAKMTFIDVGGHAHTVTTPASGINGADHIATFGGTVGNFIELVAYNGVWYVTASAGITLS